MSTDLHFVLFNSPREQYDNDSTNKHGNGKCDDRNEESVDGVGYQMVGDADSG